MADEVVKKLRVPASELPPLNINNQAFILRYRFVSEDKNRLSHWSPIYTLIPAYTFASGNIEIVLT
jgi:hypothetical protein